MSQSIIEEMAQEKQESWTMLLPGSFPKTHAWLTLLYSLGSPAQGMAPLTVASPSYFSSK